MISYQKRAVSTSASDSPGYSMFSDTFSSVTFSPFVGGFLNSPIEAVTVLRSDSNDASPSVV